MDMMGGEDTELVGHGGTAGTTPSGPRQSDILMGRLRSLQRRCYCCSQRRLQAGTAHRAVGTLATRGV